MQEYHIDLPVWMALINPLLLWLTLLFAAPQCLMRLEYLD
jgi:hypothetical protein